MRILDPELTKEYRLARECVPDIVAIESDPLKHLRAEDGHASKAATRAALYWKKRRHYFGEDRWLLPMTQTEGTGALSLEDIQVLRSGYIVIVTLHSGQQVAMIDPSRLCGRDPGESRERCMFYLCTNEIKERSLRYGMEMIFLLTAYGFASERQTELIDVLYNALPTKVRHLTILQSVQEGRKELLDFLAFRLEKTFEFFTPTKVTVVRVESRQVVLDALERRGIHRQYLPKQLGGDYDYSQLSEWVQTRLVVENAMGAALPKRNALPRSFRSKSRRSNSFSLKKPGSSAHMKLSPRGASPDCVTSILWSDFQRKRKDCQSKKKSRKVKRPSAMFPDEFELKSPNGSFKDANQRLHTILTNVLDSASSAMTI